MGTTNVGRNEKSVTTNMIVTYPGTKGIEVSTKGQSIKIREYMEKVGSVKIGVINNSERELKAYLAKYAPEKLKDLDKSEDVR